MNPFDGGRTGLPIRGAGGGKGGGGGGHESDDTLFSSAYVELVEAIGEGPMRGLVQGGRGVYLDDTPILDASGGRNHRVTLAVATGWQGQDPIPAFTGAGAEQQVDALVLHDSPVTAAVTNADTDYAVVTLTFPRLMAADNRGNIKGSAVTFKIEYQAAGDAWRLVSRNSKIVRATAPAQPGLPFVSPQHGYGADVTVYADRADPVDILHSLNGGTYAVIATVVPEPMLLGGRVLAGLYTADVFLPLPEGVHRLKWDTAWYGTRPAHTFYRDFVLFHVYEAAAAIEVKGKTMSPYQKQYRFKLAGAAPWQVRVTRISPDSNSAKLANDLYFTALRSEETARLNYPNTALLYYRIPAQAFSRIPSRRSLWRGRSVRVPANYDPLARTYDGVWGGGFKTAWTDNPAWCFYDLCSNARFGLGQYIDRDDIDKWALYAIAQYCDGLVDSGRRDETGAVISEPRFTLNVQITGRVEAFTLLRNLASVFRGMLYVLDGQLTAVADQPADPVALFTPANVSDGQFVFSGTAALARKTVALVEWQDPDDMYNTKVEYVDDPAAIARYGVNETRLVAFGCTRRGQAYRLGRWALLDGETVSFGVGLDAARLRPGDIVQCMIPLRSGGQRLGGRILAVDGVAVTLDAPVSLLAGHSYQLSAVLADGTVGTQDVVAGAGAPTSVLTLAAAFATAPLAGALWVLVDLDGIRPTLWRVVGITPGEGLTATVTALSHDPDKYAGLDSIASSTGGTLPLIQTLSVPAPATVVIENLAYKDNNGTQQNKLHVHWHAAGGAVRHQIAWRVDNGDWRWPSGLDGTLWELPIDTGGVYDVEVRAVDFRGQHSAPALASAVISVLGDRITYPVNHKVTGTVPHLITVLPLVAGYYPPPEAVFGCPDGARTATVEFRVSDGTVLASVSGAGGIKKRTAAAGFTLDTATEVSLVAYTDTAGIPAIIKSYSL